MSTVTVQPGPDADRAFRLGILAAAVAALAGLGAAHWAGAITLAHVATALVLGFPVYLLCWAVVLSVWLGFTKDATDLRPVHREPEESESGPE